MNYIVEIDDEIMKAKKSAKHKSIWMCRVPREKPVDKKPGVYILVDGQGYCCYVGETSNLQERMRRHRNGKELFWWTHTVYFWDENSDASFQSTDDRHWYEKKLKESVEFKHPTFTDQVSKNPRKPEGGEEVLYEMLDLLKVIEFDAEVTSSPSSPRSDNLQVHNRNSLAGRRRQSISSTEPFPRKNHRPPLGNWPTYTALAKAIAERRGISTAGGILQKLTNLWIPSRGSHAKANAETRQMLESLGVKFDADGFVKSCAEVPYPLP